MIDVCISTRMREVMSFFSTSVMCNVKHFA